MLKYRYHNMNKIVLILIAFALFFGFNSKNSWANIATGQSIYHYGYNDREHSMVENAENIGIVYGLTWFFYPLTQPKILRGHGSVEEYSRHFGHIVFDQDEPFWNSFVHPISGSQLYLLYRANGYDRMAAFQMTLISSTLFELTVEIFTEPASVQDLFQTPVLGSFLGYGIENASMYLINSGNTFGKFFGHLINPATILPIYEGRTLIIPKLEDADKGALIRWEGRF